MSRRVVVGRDQPILPPVYRMIKLLTTPLLKTLRVRSEGVEHLDMPGGYILASNHASWLDPLIAGALERRVIHYLGHSGLAANKYLATFFREQGRLIFVDRSRRGNQDALRAAVEVLDEGRVLGIFPEGYRTRDGLLLPFRSGAARIALASGAPIVPMALTTYANWPRHAPLPDLSIPVGVAIGEPIRFDDFNGMHQDRAVVAKATEELRAQIQILLDQAHVLKEQ